jgi:hypothetical protein
MFYTLFVYTSSILLRLGFFLLFLSSSIANLLHLLYKCCITTTVLKTIFKSKTFVSHSLVFSALGLFDVTRVSRISHTLNRRSWMWRGRSRCRSPTEDTKYCQAFLITRLGPVGEDTNVEEQVYTLRVLGWKYSIVEGGG